MSALFTSAVAPRMCPTPLVTGGQGMTADDAQNIIYLAGYSTPVSRYNRLTGATSVSTVVTNGGRDVALTPDRRYLYVTSGVGLHRIDTATMTEVSFRPNVDFGNSNQWPWGVDVHPHTGEVYVAVGLIPAQDIRGEFKGCPLTLVAALS